MITADKESAIINASSVIKQRFLSRLVKAENGCEIWSGYKNRDGYGALTLFGKVVRAHRVAYALNYGSIPSGMVVRHSCHNPACCNPEHLKVGTQYDNVQDMVRANRHKSELKRKPKTIEHAAKISQALKAYRNNCKENGYIHRARHKLTDEQVANLRHDYRSGMNLTELSCKYGIGKSAASNVANGRTYAHVG